MTKHTKGSKYQGVYKCNKTQLYYCKKYKGKKYFVSKLFKNELDAVKKYNEMSTKKISNVHRNIKICKRPKILEYVKIVVYSRQNDKCTLCNNNLGIGRVIDHIIPRSIGGFDNINNYQAICGACNKWKTYKFDHQLKAILKKNKKLPSLKTTLQIQKKEYIKFNGVYKY